MSLAITLVLLTAFVAAYLRLFVAMVKAFRPSDFGSSDGAVDRG